MLGVLALSDAFANFWPGLAASLDLPLHTGATAGELGSLAGACGVLVGAGGVEHAAPEALRELRRLTTVPLAVVGVDTDYRVVQAIVRAGAEEYFAVPADTGALRAWLAERRDTSLQQAAPQALRAEQPALFGFSRLIGESAALQAVLEHTRKAVPLANLSVLITGETGTGKELLAQAIHYSGPRGAHPFVEINCAALPATLIEAELFGYEKGAFTDARGAKPGLFEVAQGGSLFLDEVGDLPFELQAKLLKVLDNKTVRRLGGLQESSVDVRLIAATHRDLRQCVEAGTFREDLFYRLNVFPLHLPPLRERERDVLLLAESFVAQISADYGRPCPSLTPEAEAALLAHRWPGNVRELKNALERAVALCGSGLEPRDLGLDGAAPAPQARAEDVDGVLPFPAPLERIERAAAAAALAWCGGNKSEAARLLQITRKRLYALLEAEAANRSPSSSSGQGRAV